MCPSCTIPGCAPEGAGHPSIPCLAALPKAASCEISVGAQKEISSYRKNGLYTVEFELAIKKKEIIPFVEVEISMRSKNQEREIWHVVSHAEYRGGGKRGQGLFK